MRHSLVIGEPIAASAFGGDPYEAAVERGGGTLRLRTLSDGTSAAMDVGRWLESDEVDADLVRRTRGSVLDVGCGPGRLVRTAVLDGRVALGLDVSAAATRHAAARGLPVLRRSVFTALPGARTWDAVILADGNIGIGGDPVALLSRCAQLMAPAGRVHVETDDDPARDRRYLAQLSDDEGRRGPVFAWAELGRLALRMAARAAGLVVDEEWASGGRSFSVLRGDAARAA